MCWCPCWALVAACCWAASYSSWLPSSAISSSTVQSASLHSGRMMYFPLLKSWSKSKAYHQLLIYISVAWPSPGSPPQLYLPRRASQHPCIQVEMMYFPLLRSSCMSKASSQISNLHIYCFAKSWLPSLVISSSMVQSASLHSGGNDVFAVSELKPL